MFGVETDILVENLERLRKRLCVYAGDTCDCKFGAAGGHSEQTGCPEIRQAIKLIQGKHDEVTLLRHLLEQSAVNTLADIRRALDEHDRAEKPADLTQSPGKVGAPSAWPIDAFPKDGD